MNIKSLTIGLLVGSLVTSSITLLTTPSSGKQMQRRIKEQLTTGKENLQQIKQQYTNTTKQLKGTIAITKEQGQDFVNETKNIFSDYQKDIAPSLQRLKSDIDDLQKQVNDMKKK
ncbi:YtxH domain-containing protein [Bacillus sp. JCM 19034]|uniref:YtxH domain-containing protein n=1 Tax=Bacillus sp. JCM 19034 TaxID=1481928 RepID=UPI000782B10E|nr:YtxH domain-containing protein [Bacillus sp. JCM 19034]